MIPQQHQLDSFNLHSNQINSQHRVGLQRYSSNRFDTIQDIDNHPIPNQSINQKNCRQLVFNKIKSNPKIIMNPSSQQSSNFFKDKNQPIVGINSISELIIPQHQKNMFRLNEQDLALPQQNKIRKGSYNVPKNQFITYGKNQSSPKILKQTISKLRNTISNNLYKKYAPNFLFFMGKTIDELIYNQSNELSCIDFKDIASYSQEFQYLKRFYEYRTSTNKNEILDKLVQLISIYGKKQIMMNSMSATLSSTMIITQTKSIFIRRHKRRQRLFFNWTNELSQEKSQEKSKISPNNFKKLSKSKQWGSLSFLNGNLSIFQQKNCKLQFKKSKNTKQTLTKCYNDNLEFQETHNVFNSISSNQSYKNNNDDLKDILENLLPTNMFKVTSSSEYLQVNHLVNDFNDIDEQITMKNYRELEKRKKEKNEQNLNKDSGIMQISAIQGSIDRNKFSQQIKEIETFDRKSIRFCASPQKDEHSIGDQTPRFINMNSKSSYHKKKSSSQIIQRKQMNNSSYLQQNQQKAYINQKIDYLEPPNILLNQINNLLQSDISDRPSIVITGSQRLDESEENKTLNFSQDKNDTKIELKTTKKLEEVITEKNKQLINQTSRKKQQMQLIAQASKILQTNDHLNIHSHKRRQRYDSFQELIMRQANTEKFPKTTFQKSIELNTKHFLKKNNLEKPTYRKKQSQAEFPLNNKSPQQYTNLKHNQFQISPQPDHKVNKVIAQQLLKVKSETNFKKEVSLKFQFRESNGDTNLQDLEKKGSNRIKKQMTSNQGKRLQRVQSTKLIGINHNLAQPNLTPKYQKKKCGNNSNFDQLMKNYSYKIKNPQNKPDNFTMHKKQQYPHSSNRSNQMYQEYLKKKEQKNLGTHKSPEKNIMSPQFSKHSGSTGSPKAFAIQKYMLQKKKNGLVQELQTENNNQKTSEAKNSAFSKITKKLQPQSPKQIILQKNNNLKDKNKYFQTNFKRQSGFSKAHPSEKIYSPTEHQFKSKYYSPVNIACEDWKNNKIKQQHPIEVIQSDSARYIVNTLTFKDPKNKLDHNYRSPTKNNDGDIQFPLNRGSINFSSYGNQPEKNKQKQFWKQRNTKNTDKLEPKNQTYK